jgi:hypothetical protein
MKLRVIEPTHGDLFIIDETESPVAVGRECNLCGVIEKIGELIGVEINIEQYSGDYLYRVLSKQSERTSCAKNEIGLQTSHNSESTT